MHVWSGATDCVRISIGINLLQWLLSHVTTTKKKNVPAFIWQLKSIVKFSTSSLKGSGKECCSNGCLSLVWCSIVMERFQKNAMPGFFNFLKQNFKNLMILWFENRSWKKLRYTRFCRSVKQIILYLKEKDIRWYWNTVFTYKFTVLYSVIKGSACKI